MKILKMIAALLFAFTLGLATNGFTLSNAANNVDMDMSATPVQLATDINNLVFTGTVKRIPNGTALVTRNGTYLLSGGNFDSVIDKEVNVIGKVVKEGSIEKLEVARAQLAQN